jgi:hypothetical protein
MDGVVSGGQSCMRRCGFSRELRPRNPTLQRRKLRSMKAPREGVVPGGSGTYKRMVSRLRKKTLAMVSSQS